MILKRLIAGAALAAIVIATLPAEGIGLPPAAAGSQIISDDGLILLHGKRYSLSGLRISDGLAASRFAEEMAAGDQVDCDLVPDLTGRISARCSLAGSDFNALLVHTGLAVADASSSTDYIHLAALPGLK